VGVVLESSEDIGTKFKDCGCAKQIAGNTRVEKAAVYKIRYRYG
jgi:hypothetical protein